MYIFLENVKETKTQCIIYNIHELKKKIQIKTVIATTKYDIILLHLNLAFLLISKVFLVCDKWGCVFGVLELWVLFWE